MTTPSDRPASGKLSLTPNQLSVLLLAVEYGYRQCERGNSLQLTLSSACHIFKAAAAETSEIDRPAEQQSEES